MSISASGSQNCLAVTMIASFIGTYIALSPPNTSTEPPPPSGDTIRWLSLTKKHTTKITLAPIGLLALHSSCLASLHPNIPSSVLRHGAANALNTDLITWSAATSVPLALILCTGIPLRLVSYASLGKNFTFALAEPDHLTTGGIYRYVQHPGYTGLAVLAVCNVALVGRVDGVLSCWISPAWYQPVKIAWWVLAPAGLSLLVFAMWTRVRQEERMLRAKFGVEWEEWNARTPRFVPRVRNLIYGEEAVGRG